MRSRQRLQPVPAGPRHRRSCAQAIAAHQQRFYGLTYDPDTEVLVTAGATEAIAAALLALLEPGDEVVAFEPFYDSYAACIAMAGAAAPHRSRCAAPDFRSTSTSCAPRSPTAPALILLNTPHNPTGKVLHRERARARSPSSRIEHDLIVVTDEVYEHLVFDGAAHPDRDAARACASARSRSPVGGKTFSLHGLEDRLGVRAAGARRRGPHGQAVPHLRQRRRRSSPRSPPASACPTSYFAELHAPTCAPSATCCATGSRDAGFGVYRPQGTYFVTADIRPLGDDDGVAFCRVAARALRRRRHPERRVLRRRRRGPTARALRVLQAPRGARRGGRPAEEGCAHEGRRHPARHRAGRTPKANMRHLAPMIAGAAACRRAPRRAHRDVRHRLLDGGRAHRRAAPTGRRRRSSPSRPRPHGVWLVGVDPDAASARRRARSTASCSPRPAGASHRYAKIHPFTYARRARALRRPAPTSSPSTSRVCAVSLFVCYDLRFADEFWALAPRHRLLPRRAPTGPRAARQHWRTLLVARAIENQAYVVGVNRVGEGGGLAYSGDSRIIDPLGEVIAGGARSEAIADRRSRSCDGAAGAHPLPVLARPPLSESAGSIGTLAS